MATFDATNPYIDIAYEVRGEAVLPFTIWLHSGFFCFVGMKEDSNR